MSIRIKGSWIERRKLFFLLAFGVVGLAIRVYLSMRLPTDWDTGSFLYWGKFVIEGETPFRDFLARDPFFIYFVAISLKFFGFDTFAVVAVSAAFGTLTVFTLYSIATRVWDSKTGLIASAIYTFAPTVLWYSTIGDARPTMLFFTSVAMLLLIQALRSQHLKFFIFYGIMIGLSVYIYRGVGIYILTIPILLTYVNINLKGEEDIGYSLKKTVVQTTCAFVGFSIALFLVLSYYSYTSSLKWMWSFYGLGSQQESIAWFIVGEAAGIQHRIRIFYVAVREWLYLVIPAVIFLGINLQNKLRDRPHLRHFTTYTLGIFLLIILISGEYFWPVESYGAYEAPAIYKIIFLAILTLLVSLPTMIFPRLQKSFNNFNNAIGTKFGNTFVMWWFVSTTILIALFGAPLVNYYYYLSPPLTIITAMVIRATLSLSPFCTPTGETGKGRNVAKKVMPIFFVSLLISSASITAGMIASSEINYRNQATSTIHKIANYIKQHTSESDEILVGNPAIALIADRKVAFNIVLHLMYGEVGPEPFDPLPYDPYNFFPNVHEIAEYMGKGNVKYVVADGTGLVEDIIPLHPEWDAAFRSWYVLETVIDGRPIYVYKSEYEPS